ncbi:GNAT family N-acetyltransferase [Rhodobium gokarnense]|uniref:N-acetylglutamate synthase-like GNAT family acetyltransferase n=1 Tax=Rhodobium gokarnense TaxID=364296 RepID=A0ABT3H727_9HYPH|nr:GNAT family N-acetyltransferase [Rhodobium gokarnense]MCW2306185.1 N-acetylglutamate synthase-like GNAT family acetyltransferase [Rhodobium gokarnense]
MTAPVDLIPESDADWIADFLTKYWGAPTIVARGEVIEAASLSGFRAVDRDGTLKGFASYRIEDDALQIVTLDSFFEGGGTGQALVARVLFEAREKGCSKVWLVTTNDNLHALRFYQRRGFRIVAVYPGAMDAARKLKPEIPAIGANGIPIRDEIELEMCL